MKLRFCVFLAISLMLGYGVFAQTPKMPFTDVGACPFECCTYREWTVKRETVIYKEMRGGSPIAYRVKKSDKVMGLTGVVITTRAGRVKALKDFTFAHTKVRVKAGDIFYTLTYRGEGFFLIWYKGKKFESEVSEESKMKFLVEPASIWWVKIRNRKGQIGWTMKVENFDNMDACG